MSTFPWFMRRLAPMMAFAALVTAGSALGASQTVPSEQGSKAPLAYRDRFIAVNGARLYVADWGREGPLMILLPGFGTGAHIFDGLAPAFNDRFHVIALTPRGFPPSSAPDSGYTIAQLAADVHVVVDSLGGGRVALAGHSIAGAVMTQFAIAYPDRVLAVVYL